MGSLKEVLPAVIFCPVLRFISEVLLFILIPVTEALLFVLHSLTDRGFLVLHFLAVIVDAVASVVEAGFDSILFGQGGGGGS